jgi:hypothetical protein
VPTLGQGWLNLQDFAERIWRRAWLRKEEWGDGSPLVG